jgi:hypothetical protein
MNKVFSIKNNKNNNKPNRIGVRLYSDNISKDSLDNVKVIEIDTDKISLKEEEKLSQNNEVTASDIGKNKKKTKKKCK